MKTLPTSIAACMLLAGCTNSLPRDQAAVPTPPQTTEHYYQQLVSNTPLNLAELSLFLNRMPKGGDLHHHYSGALYAETYVDWVDKAHYCVYKTDYPLTGGKKFKIETKPEALATLAQERIKAGKKDEPAENNCLSGSEILADNGFYRELLSVWSDKDFANHVQLQPPPDKQFFDTFSYFGDVSDFSFQDGLQIIKARAKQENVQYIETMLKSSPSIACPAEIAERLSALNDQSSDTDIEKVLTDYFNFLEQDNKNKQAITEFVAILENLGAKLDDEEFTLRFQTYVSRNSKPEKIFSGLYSSFAADKASARIVGVNFVSPENGYVAMRDYHLHMKMFQFFHQRFPESKISLHAGELVVGMVPPEGLSFHINEAVKIAGANRIGHGVDIPNEANAPDLLDLMRKQNVAVEINLTSNEFILGVSSDEHPLPLYQNYGVPYVISTDDAGVSRSTLGQEYLLFASRYKPTYQELKQTVYNSIRYSFLTEQEKKTQLNALDKKFSQFERSVENRANSTN